MNTSKLPQHLMGLTSGFGKNAEREALLGKMNDLLVSAELELEQTTTEAPEPLLFILGPPRSGTTLVSQLTQASQAFCTLTNLAAHFWKAPALGLMLSSVLEMRNGDTTSDFKSLRGVTGDLWEPHEFGYFWSRWFDLGQETHFLDPETRARVDTEGLVRSIVAMQSVQRRPLAFKNNTWFSFQADLLAEVFPQSVFISCSRDPYYVAQSIWMQRIDLYGDPARWWSVRPPDYADIIQLPPLEQVARQAVSIELTTSKTLARVDPARVIRADYTDVVREPRKLVTEAVTAVLGQDAVADVPFDKIPQRFETTDRSRLDEDTAVRLRAAVDKWRSILG